jgi:hypothetical protein
MRHANDVCAVKGFIKDSMCVQTDPEMIDPYASAWILGDKLQCVEFQNYAMDNIFTNYCTQSNKSRIVTSKAIDKLLSIETCSPQLATVFIHCVASQFRNQHVVKGSIDEWDRVMLKHSKLRRVMLITSKYHKNAEFAIKGKEPYMVEKKERPVPVSPSQQNGVVTPAKRTANGTPVQRNATDCALQDRSSAQATQSTEPVKAIKQDEEAVPEDPFIIGLRAADIVRGCKCGGVAMKQETDT